MRKIYFNLSVLLLFSLAIWACKKETATIGSGTSGFTLVNGVVGNGSLLTNFNGTELGVPYYSLLTNINYGWAQFYSNYTGQQKLALYQIPDTTPTSKPVYNLTLDLPVNTVHTLFLMGTPQNPDQLFTADQLLYHAPADSTMGIRFINISRGSAPVSVNINGKTSGSEVTSLPYKSITAFKIYPAGSAVSSYTFEFRDQATGTLLASYTLNGINSSGPDGTGPNIWRSKNITLSLLKEPAGFPSSRVLVVRY
jgi:hypothetical protein